MKQLTSIFLLLAIAFSLTNSSMAVATSPAQEDIVMPWETASDNPYNKIHVYLGDVDYSIIDNSDELNDAVNCLKSDDKKQSNSRILSETEPLQVTVQFKSDFDDLPQVKQLRTLRDTVETAEEIDMLRSQLHQISKEYHSTLVSQNMSLLDEWDFTDSLVLDYTPYVVLKVEESDIDANRLIALANNELIENVCIDEKIEPIAESTSWNQSMLFVGALEIVAYGEITGQGVKIGIYESGGVCDTSYDLLSDKDITIRDSSATVTDHATYVTSILANIAPDAEFYVAPVDSPFNLSSLEWFVDNGCDIINCSYGYYYGTSNSYKQSIDGVFDYFVHTTDIIVVKSAGNYNSSYNPNNQISSPGYAHNVITVGGVDRIDGQLQYSSSASYVTSDANPKPNISAPNAPLLPGGISIGSGTSYSAPIVSGMIALLLEEAPGYRFPEKIMALITSTATKNSDYSETNGYFDERVGAGVIDLTEMIECQNNIVTYADDEIPENSTLFVETVTITEGTELQVGFSWLVTLESVTSSPYLLDYDIALFEYPQESGTTNYASILTDGNVEMFRAEVEVGKTYNIIVVINDARTDSSTYDYMALTYNVN